MRTVMNDAHGALLRSVRRLIAGDALLAGLLMDRQLPSLLIEGLSSEAWSSATFAGHRHRLELKLHGSSDLPDLRERLEKRFSDPDVSMRGHVLVDIALVKAETRVEDGGEVCRLSFEALTVED